MLLLATKRYKCLMLRDRFGAKSPLAMSPPLVARVCHATPCYTMLHYASPCFTMLHHHTPFYTMLHHATPCYAVLHHATLCFTMLHHSTLCYTISHATLPKSQVRIVHSIMVVGMMIILVVVSDKYYTGYC